MLFKNEVTYLTDAAPNAAEGLVLSNVSFTPIEGEEVKRDLLLPYLGNQGSVLTAMYGKIEFDLEITGSGAAGSVPKYSSVLRAAGLAATITAGVSVDYTIIEDAVESATMHFVSDGVRHIFLGGQANIAMSFVPKQIPKFRVTFLGMLGTITDVVSMPAVTMAGWTDPQPVSKANTTMTLHGWASTAESLSVDLGNTLSPRFLIGDEAIRISDRQSSGSAVVEARSLAVVDWFERAKTGNRDALLLTHGVGAGRIIEISAPAVQIGKPTQGQTDNIINYTLPLSVCPVSGLDELKITFR